MSLQIAKRTGGFETTTAIPGFSGLWVRVHQYVNAQGTIYPPRIGLYRVKNFPHPFLVDGSLEDRKRAGQQRDSPGARCEVCGSTRRLTTDHDHKTRRLRGILCTRCNFLMTAFEDAERKRAFEAYLERHSPTRGVS